MDLQRISEYSHTSDDALVDDKTIWLKSLIVNTPVPLTLVDKVLKSKPYLLGNMKVGSVDRDGARWWRWATNNFHSQPPVWFIRYIFAENNSPVPDGRGRVIFATPGSDHMQEYLENDWRKVRDRENESKIKSIASRLGPNVWYIMDQSATTWKP